MNEIDKSLAPLLAQAITALCVRNTFLCRQEEPDFLVAFLRMGDLYTARWDSPQVEERFVLPVKRSRRKPRQRDGQ